MRSRSKHYFQIRKAYFPFLPLLFFFFQIQSTELVSQPGVGRETPISKERGLESHEKVNPSTIEGEFGKTHEKQSGNAIVIFFEYVFENKQWIFSGIGISVISALIWMVGRFFSTKE